MSTVIPFVSGPGQGDIEAWLQVLQHALPEYRVLPFSELDEAQRAGVEVAIVADPEPAELAMLPKLKWVQSLWAGVERLMAELPDASFDIVRMTDPQLAVDMSEAVLAWTLYLHREMPLLRRQQENKIWRVRELVLPSDRCVGFLGLGKLGKVAARRMVDNGFDVCGWSRSLAELDGVDTYSGVDGLAEVLKRSNIVVVLVPLTEQTRDLLDDETFALMPKGAAVINFARGPVINDDALLKVLDNGHLSHAVLDVFDVEPLPRESVLWSHPAITILPHISARTNHKTASAIAAENITRFFASGELPETVDRTLGY